MPINLSGYLRSGISDIGNGQTGQTVRNASAADGGAQGGKESVRTLTPGQTITGEIVSKEGNEIQLRLSGDTVIQARMEQAISASAGNYVTFEVGSSQSGILALRPLFQNLAQDSTAMKALTMAGIEPGEASLQMVSAMMEEGMSVSRDALQAMYRQINSLPEADIRSLVQLSRMEIPITPENIEQFEAYKNYEHKLVSAFEEVAEAIPDAVAGVFEEQGGGEGNALIQRLLRIFDASGAEAAEGIAEGVSESSANAEEKALEMAGSEPALAESREERLIGELSARNHLEEAAGPDGKGAQALQEEGTLPFKAQDLSADAPREDPGRLLLTQEQRTQLAKLLQTAGEKDGLAERVLSGQAEQEEIYQAVRHLSAGADTPQEQTAVKDLFLSQGFQKILQEKISNQWTFRPEDVDKKEVSRLYERLNEQTRQLTQALSESVKTDSPLYKSVANIRENMDFMNQLNQIYSYVQLPLKFQGENAHGDLYVYTNKKNLAKKDGNVSAYLHLNMEHLGAVNVYVAMQQEKIHTNFYLADEESLDLLEKHIDILTKRLTEKGYRVDAKLMMQEESKTVMEEILDTDRNVSVVSELSFDVRA